MRAVIGVNSVRATLEKSLLRAQKRFNLSNPPSLAKDKRSKKRIEDRKITKRLQHLARQNRLRFGSELPDEQVVADWRELCVNPLHIEFEPSVDKYSDFVEQFKSQTSIFDKSARAPKAKRLESTTNDKEEPLLLLSKFPTQKKSRKKGDAKKLRKLRKLYRKSLEKLKGIGRPAEDEEALIPKKVSNSKLELIREERRKVRLLEKAIRKEAQRIRVEQQKEATRTSAGIVLKKEKSKRKTMKDVIASSSIGEADTSSSQANQASSNGGGGESSATVMASSPAASISPKTTNVTAKLTLITNGSNGIVKKNMAEPQLPKPQLITNGSNGIVKKSTEPQLPKPKYTIFPRDKVQTGWNQKYPTGCGFDNLGNSCYMNSTLQAVFHIPSFVNWLLNDTVHRRQCQSSQRYQQCMVCAMRNTLEESMNQNYSMRPHQIHNKLRMISKNFLPGRQEDAHEFLRHLLESMEVSYLRAYGATNFDTRSKETTPLGQIFGGYLRTEVTCLKCNFVSTTFQPLAELQLDIRHASTVEDAISNHFRKEKVDNNDYKCEGCRSVVPVMKQFSLELAPVVLCLQLKRFTLFGGKLSKPVHCNQYLDLTKYLHNSLRTQNHRELKYRMVALITHIGSSPNGGHYTAIAETSSGTMYQFDDSYVRSVSLTMAQNTDAYVIIYEMTRGGQETKPGSLSAGATPVRSPSISASAQLRSPINMSAAAQMRNNPITAGLFSQKAHKVSTVTSATVNNVVAKPSKLVISSPSSSSKFLNPFADRNSENKPTASVAPFSKSPSSSIGPNGSASTPTTNGNRGFMSPGVKPRSERPPISFSMKNTGVENGGSKTPNVRSCLTPLRPPIASQQQPQKQKTPPPKQVNGASKSPQPQSKPHSLVPYDNEDDSEEGSTPRRDRSRERSSTPKNTGDAAIKTNFDANLLTAPIKTWNNEAGTGSVLAKATEVNRKRDLLKTDTDLYNEELDSGRIKKRKLDSRSPSRDNNAGMNKFQNYEDQRRLVNERTKSLNMEPSPSKSQPKSSSTNGFSKDPYRTHHHGSGTPNGGDSRPSSSLSSSHGHSSSNHQQHENPSHNHNNRTNYFSRNNSHESHSNHRGGGGGFKRHSSSPSYNNRFNQGGWSHNGRGGGGGRGSWRGNSNNYYKGQRNYTNYHRQER